MVPPKKWVNYEFCYPQYFLKEEELINLFGLGFQYTIFHDK